MKKAIVAIFYRDKKTAIKMAEEKRRIYGISFKVLSFTNGFLVVSERQLKQRPERKNGRFSGKLKKTSRQIGL